jgi:NAD(P)-dependent dehydrogenase (short-subunit alcohol dehydrogenase family)
MSQQLKNKSIVIIGGTTGIGLSAAKVFIAEGAKVVVVGRNADSVAKAKKILGKDAEALAADAQHPETANNSILTCIEEFGSFDGLYHVAGGSGRKFGDGPLHELTMEGWNKTLELNLTSLMLSNQAAVKAFLKQKKAGTKIVPAFVFPAIISA